MSKRPWQRRRREGGCYRVLVVAITRSSVMPWTVTGGDQSYRYPRRSWITVAATSEQEAREHAEHVGAQLMGGRPVRVEAIEKTCEPGTHNNEIAPTRLRFALVAA